MHLPGGPTRGPKGYVSEQSEQENSYLTHDDLLRLGSSFEVSDSEVSLLIELARHERDEMIKHAQKAGVVKSSLLEIKQSFKSIDADMKPKLRRTRQP